MSAGRLHTPTPMSCSVLAGALLCASIAIANPPRAEFRVLENTPDHITVQVLTSDFASSLVEINGQPHAIISLGREAPLQIAGAPDLPHIARSVMLPSVGDVSVSVDESASVFTEMSGIDIAPSKGNLYRDTPPGEVPFWFDAAKYTADDFFPGALADVGDPYILRDTRGVAVRLFPFQYNAARRTLRVYTQLTATIRISGDGGVNAMPADAILAQSPSLAFENLYQMHYANYEPESRYTPLTEAGGMLIICHDAWLPNVQPLVDHRNATGIPTNAVGVSTIGNTTTAIKSYIQSRYNQGDLAFVLLVGDYTQVATPQSFGGSADPTYAKCAGSDNYPDLMIGRFSAETAAQVDTQVQRTVEYEQLEMVSAGWFKTAVGLASAQGAGIGDDGEADWQHEDNIRTLLMTAGGYTTVDQIYDTNGGSAAMVTNAVNAGRGLINYTGHGSQNAWSTTGFSNSHVNALNNQDKLPFIVSVACVNGQFEGGTCFAEAWLRATKDGNPTGAVAMYASSINQSWAPPMEGQDEFNDLLVAGTYNCIGTLFFAGSCSMMDKYGAGAGGAGTEMYDTWHCFGDPALRVVGIAAPPSGIKVTPFGGLTVSGQQGGPFPGEMTYTIENFEPTPVSYAVSSDKFWVRIADPTGTIPPGGTADIDVSIDFLAANLANGQHNANVYFTNLMNGDGDAVRTVQLNIGSPTRQYDWPLNNNPGWTVSGQWAFGDPLGSGGGTYGFPDPQNPHTGANVYGVNLAGNYGTAIGGPWHLRTGAIDCSALSQVSVRFRRWLNSDHQPYVHATLDVSNNGTTWSNVWSNGTSEIKDNLWQAMSYDISQVADGQSTVYVRWGYQVANGAYPYSGWNIDDVEIWGLSPTGPAFCIGDMNCDGQINFADIDPFVEALTYAGGAGWPHQCAWRHGDTNGDDAVNFADIDPFVTLIGTNCP